MREYNVHETSFLVGVLIRFYSLFNKIDKLYILVVVIITKETMAENPPIVTVMDSDKHEEPIVTIVTKDGRKFELFRRAIVLHSDKIKNLLCLEAGEPVIHLPTISSQTFDAFSFYIDLVLGTQLTPEVRDSQQVPEWAASLMDQLSIESVSQLMMAAYYLESHLLLDGTIKYLNAKLSKI